MAGQALSDLRQTSSEARAAATVRGRASASAARSAMGSPSALSSPSLFLSACGARASRPAASSQGSADVASRR